MAQLKNYEALLNEYKGNLFEYLFALALSRKLRIELEFLNNISPGMQEMLEQQESYLRNYFPIWLAELPRIAELASQEMIERLELGEVREIFLVGKSLGALGGRAFDEADILLKKEGQELPVSIKIYKHNSYVNTKSAGVRTFFKKYFSGFEGESTQKKFNDFCDLKYEEMSMKMHAEAGIDYLGEFKNWEDSGLEVMPGLLNAQFKLHLLDYYSCVNEWMFKRFKNFYKKNSELFLKCLSPLLGYSRPEVIQIIAFYKKKQEQILTTQALVLKYEGGAKRIQEIKKAAHSFELEFQDYALQIRLKPMNKFTTKAFKINCGVKHFL